MAVSRPGAPPHAGCPVAEPPVTRTDPGRSASCPLTLSSSAAAHDELRRCAAAGCLTRWRLQCWPRSSAAPGQAGQCWETDEGARSRLQPLTLPELWSKGHTDAVHGPVLPVDAWLSSPYISAHRIMVALPAAWPLSGRRRRGGFCQTVFGRTTVCAGAVPAIRPGEGRNRSTLLRSVAAAVWPTRGYSCSRCGCKYPAAWLLHALVLMLSILGQYQPGPAGTGRDDTASSLGNH